MKRLLIIMSLLLAPNQARAQESSQAFAGKRAKDELTADEIGKIASYRQTIQHDMRLAHVGYQLSKANAHLCPVTAHNMGWVLHDIAQYPDAEIARQSFDFNAPISVLGVVDGSPADVAGVRAGDGVIGIHWTAPSGRISTNPIPQDSKRNSFERMQLFNNDYARTLQKIALQNGDGENVILTVKRGDQQIELPFKPNRHCATVYILDARDKIDAGANGIHVRITQGISNFTPDEDQFAALVAHELSHNILQHARKLREAKKGLGALAAFGKKKRLRTIEQEADRLSVWLMDNAGFDTNQAAVFHMRLGTRKGKPLLGSITHNKWRKRVAYVNEEIEDIKTARNIQGDITEPLVPDILKTP